MIIDRMNHFNYPMQTVTATAPSTDVIDLRGAGASYGHANYLVTRVAEAFTAAGSATLNIQLQTSNKSDFSTGVVTVYDSGPIAKTDLLKDTFAQKVSLSALQLKQYVRVNYVVANGPMTTGKLESFITPDVEVTK